MFPSLAQNDIADRPKGQCVPALKFSRGGSFGICGSHSENVVLCEFGGSVSLSLRRVLVEPVGSARTALDGPVLNVVQLRADEQVIWIHARSHIAPVQNAHPIGNGASMDLPRDSVRLPKTPSCVRECAVSTLKGSSIPRPARRVERPRLRRVLQGKANGDWFSTSFGWHEQSIPRLNQRGSKWHIR